LIVKKSDFFRSGDLTIVKEAKDLSAVFVDFRVKERNRKTVVLGIGNLLLKDEGVGIHLLNLLEQDPIPPDVQLVEGGTSTIDILHALKDAGKIIVVDAMKAGGEPGSIYRCRPQDLVPSQESSISLHHIDFLQALKLAKQMGNDLENRTVILGVEPFQIEWEMNLSPVVQGKIPLIKRLVLEEIQNNEFTVKDGLNVRRVPEENGDI
jgi:hydrogenase maturation protease